MWLHDIITYNYINFCIVILWTEVTHRQTVKNERYILFFKLRYFYSIASFWVSGYRKQYLPNIIPKQLSF